MTAAAPLRDADAERQEPREARIRLIPFNDITLGTARRDLVKGLIPRVGLTVVWGPPKCGKSFWAFDLSMHVALGWQYRGRRVHQGAVVYCAFEGQTGFAARVEAFRCRFLAEDHDAPPFYLEPVTLDLVADHKALIAVIHRQLGSVKPVAVVLDTLNRSLRGSESNDADMSAYVRAADAIREAFECAVIIVHHCGIEGSRPRGHTSLTGACDAQIAVRRADGDQIVATVEHMKDGREGDTIMSRLERIEIGTDEDGEPISSCTIVPSDRAPPKMGGPKIGGQAGVALELLRRTLVDQGQPAPTSNHIPGGTSVTTLDAWRGYVYAGSVTDGGTKEAKRKAFYRVVKKLQSIKAIGLWNEHVWII